ncbi:MAG: SPFH domain-containing protein [Phycisphaerales bacterium]
MSDPIEPQGPDQAPEETPASDLPAESGRSQSVRLRDAQTRAGASLVGERMDTANQSLRDALRITFRLVQLAMIVLAFLFIFSGFRAIQEGERGISTFFGRPVQTSLEPGFHPAWPYPIGEVITIGTGTREVAINRAFFPWVKEGEENRAESDLSTSRKLDPARDGSLITADQNIAHAQWTLNYRRHQPLQYASTIPPELEREIVEHVAQAAIVQAIAETTIDDLLKDAGQDGVASRAKTIAQAELDDMQAGIQIEQMVLFRKFPPVSLLESFSRVQSAVSIASEARVNARTEADRMLNAVAGPAAPVLIELINEYERHTELGDADEAARTFELIEAVLLGQPVEVNGQTVLAEVSGEVAQIIASAQQTELAVSSGAEEDAFRFRALKDQYDTNAPLMLTQQWTLAMADFLDQEFVQTFMVPEGSNDMIELRLNPDPDIIKQLDIARKRLEAERTNEERERLRRQDRFNTDRGVIRGDTVN